VKLIDVNVLRKAVHNVYEGVSSNEDYIEGKTNNFMHRCLLEQLMNDTVSEDTINEIAFAMLDEECTKTLWGYLA
jgi:hypothetical protein